MNKPTKKLLLILLILCVIASGILIFLKRYSLSGIFSRGTTPLKEHAMVAGMAPNSFLYNFESDTVNFNKDDFRKGLAHSGQISAKAFGKNTFTSAINRTALETGTDNMKAVALSAWVYIFQDDDPVEASLVFTGFRGSTNICWFGIPLSGKDLPKDQWFKISGRFDLSQVPFDTASRFQVYFWNNSPTDILVDDIFVTFSGNAERKGDSTLVDMTRAPYSAKFNYPPYPFVYFHKTDEGKGDLFTENVAFLGKDDKVVAGNYAGTGTTQLLVSGKGDNAGVYSFCSTKGKFIRNPAVIPSELMVSAEMLNMKSGSKDLLFVRGREGYDLFECANAKDLCSPGNERLQFVKKWSGVFPGTDTSWRFVPADLDGDRNDEVLGAGGDGSWKCFRFLAGKWIPVSSGTSGSLKGSFRISPGRFMQKYNSDLLLVVNENSYDLLRMDPSSKTLISCFKGGEGGKTIGPDTLRVSDRFFAGDLMNNGTPRVFRYNRDWRYDLKEISFNDSTFRILSWIDFRGYEGDRNPKYYEKLDILPGNYLKPDQNDWFLILRNPKSEMYPDATGIYGLRN